MAGSGFGHSSRWHVCPVGHSACRTAVGIYAGDVSRWRAKHVRGMVHGAGATLFLALQFSTLSPQAAADVD